MSDHFRSPNKTCLNGWWDFLPVFGRPAGERVPEQGWLKNQYLAPSFWTKPTDGVRRKGDVYFQDQPEIFKQGQVPADTEFLFDAFGYPDEWSRTRTAWIRRVWNAPALAEHRRRVLLFEGLMPRSAVFIDGRMVATHSHPSLPLEVDVTDLLGAGNHELAVSIEDYERDARGRSMTPTGNWIPIANSGIWQDVYVVERGDVYLSDVTIRTSVRNRVLSLCFELTNSTGADRDVWVLPDVRSWLRGIDPERAPIQLFMSEFQVHVPANGRAVREISVSWPDARWWSPESPSLYTLRTAILDRGVVSDVTHERFGFREVWFDGPRLMLNDYPLHLFSDWGHKLTPYYYTEAWIRKWFGMIRDCNMNHSRLHTHPHPRLILELADEEGILITGETGIHGSSGDLAGDEPAFWAAARDHIQRFVRRDKNHPSVILWSVENEVRWLSTETRLKYEELPALRRLFNELDPTRAAYHEGDSSMWNEAEQPIVSRHYQKACAGIGWWNGRQPLHSGEMSLYHYAGPNNTAHLGGDHVWSDFKALDEAAATDTAHIIESARTLGVTCLGPWNLSCLENLRMENKTVKLRYRDFTLPGVKPLQVPAHSSEFEFWKRGRGYTPNHSFAIQRRAFRPFAIVDRSLRSAVFAGAVFKRELFVINDTPGPASGHLEVRLSAPGRKGRILHTISLPMDLARGACAPAVFELAIPDTVKPGAYVYSAQFKSEQGRVLDFWSRFIRIECRRIVAGSGLDFQKQLGTVAVFGPGSLRSALDVLSVKARYVTDLASDSLAGARVLIMEKNTVLPGSIQNRQVQAFARAGGRVLVMEQAVSLFAEMPLEDKPLQKLFIRAYGHSALAGMCDDDFAFWGDAAYPLIDGDAFVAERMFRKSDGRREQVLLDGDEGGFGFGGLRYAGLLELMEGNGLVIASQLRLTGLLTDVPAAEELFLNLLKRAACYEPASRPELVHVKGDQVCEGSVAKNLAAAKAGGTVLVENASAETLVAYGRALKMRLKPVDLGEVFQAVRVQDDPWLAGVSNEDTSGIVRFTYGSANLKNEPVCQTPIAPVKGLEPLLETPAKSCLKELFVLGGQSEPLRAHTLSRFLYAEKPSRAVVLGRIRVGKGWLVFNQFAPARLEGQNARLANRLQANLGGSTPNDSLLDGAEVLSYGFSQGFPETLHVLNTLVDYDFRQRLLGSARYCLEHIFCAPVLGLAGWRPWPAPGGVCSALGLDLGADIYFYSQTISQVPRKDVSSNLGVPNPDVLTFLTLTGFGWAEVSVNGAAFRPMDLATGEATLGDLALEAGGNHVLIHWHPLSDQATLRLQWHNMAKHPETQFRFE